MTDLEIVQEPHTPEQIIERLREEHARALRKMEARAELAETRANSLLERLRAAGVV